MGAQQMVVESMEILGDRTLVTLIYDTCNPLFFLTTIAAPESLNCDAEKSLSYAYASKERVR